MSRPKRKRPIGESIGGILAGFDQQVMRTTPPAQELVAKARPVRGVSGKDGSSFDIVFPDVKGGEDPAEAPAGGGSSGGESGDASPGDVARAVEAADGPAGHAGERGAGPTAGMIEDSDPTAGTIDIRGR